MLPVQQPAWRERYLELFGRVDRVLCEGPFMARAITQLGCPPDKIHVHHLGVEVDSIAYAPREWLPGSPLRVLIAASFAEKKGIPYALVALGQLRRDLAVEVTLIGDTRPSQDLDEKRRILSVIEEQQLGSVVRLLGYRPYSTVFEEAYKHHVFLAPSVTATDGDTEGGAPVSVIEMAATGLPIISTTHCDIPNVVKHGVTGLLAEERDVSGLLSHLRWLVDHSNAWRPMLDAGRRHIEVEFNARTQGERLSGHYELLVGSASRSAGS